MANFFTMTNHDLYSHMWFWAIVFSIGIGILSGHLTSSSWWNCISYSYSCTPATDIQAGITAGISLTVIGGVLGLCSCFRLGRRLKASETTTTGTVVRNTTSTETATTRNQGATELNPLGQETRNQGTEINPNHEAIELSPLGQEVRNLGAEVTNSEQEQNQQIIDLQRRLTQLENQINQQHETRIEVIPSSV